MKKEKVEGKKHSMVAVDRRATDLQPKTGEPPLETEKDDGNHKAQQQEDTVARRSTATKRTKSEAAKEVWRKRKAGLIPDYTKIEKPPRQSVNPLFDLSEEKRAKLLMWLRECPYDDAVLQMLRDQGVTGITHDHLTDFFQFETQMHWEKRMGRAALEANALVRLAEESPVKFSSGILAALGQESFRLIASGSAQPEAMNKMMTLFLRARSDERTDQMQNLKREKLRREMQDQIDHALEKLSEEVDRHPAAREAFEALRKELANCLAKSEEEL